MDQDDVEKWSTRYDDDYEQRLRDIQDGLHSALHDQGYLIQNEVVDAIRWKLDAQGGWRSGNIEKVRRLPDEFVQKVTAAALLVDDPKVQVETLASIPGIGAATASAILTFYDPEKYAIGDQYLAGGPLTPRPSTTQLDQAPLATPPTQRRRQQAIVLPTPFNCELETLCQNICYDDGHGHEKCECYQSSSSRLVSSVSPPFFSSSYSISVGSRTTPTNTKESSK